MANFNKVLLMGNLTRDPELRATQTGTDVVKFGLAVNRRWKDQSGQQKEETCFVDCAMFGSRARVIDQYLSKGQPIFVEGRLSYSTWQNQEGQKRNKLEVIVENFEFLGTGRQAGGEPDSPGFSQSGGTGGFGEGAEAEIPF